MYGSSADGEGVRGSSSTGTGVYGSSNSGSAGRFTTSSTSNANPAVEVISNSDSANALVSDMNGTWRAGLFSHEPGASSGFAALRAESSGDTGALIAVASAAEGSTYGVWGTASSPDGIGVWGRHSASTGSSPGVLGQTASTTGGGDLLSAAAVEGIATSTSPSAWVVGVRGISEGTSFSGVGVTGYHAGSGFGVYGRAEDAATGYAGWFSGRVNVTGNLSKGGGSFKIDHPLDPENKYLYHSFVESPDMMNVYNGNVELGAEGTAVVSLPEWFDVLNRDFRYQLTAIGAPGPNLYVAQEVENNQFVIAGGEPGSKVSWQVTGIRQDPYANANRIPVEEDKPEFERGYYLHPEAYGVPVELRAENARMQLDKAVVEDVPAPLPTENDRPVLDRE